MQSRYSAGVENVLAPERMLRIAVDLVNTRTMEPERLTSSAALRDFLADHDEPGPIRLDDHDLRDVKVVRARLREAFGPEPAQALNGLLREYAVPPYLTDHDGTALHLHVSDPDASWAAWLASGCALALAGVVASRGPGALGECAAGDCARVFVNAAVKRPRRFCTPTCASRSRVAAYRARSREEVAD